jgi:ribose/xylose/arabinose/galactoside ABC-type transport system permease subunit
MRYARLRLTGNEVRLAVLIILVVVFAFASRFFLTPLNISNILLAAAVVGVVACAQTLLLVAGQVDISVGSAVAFASAVFAVTAPTYGIPLAIIACIGAALVVSAVNVVGIVHFRVSSIIVTLATFIMFRGVARIVLEGRAIQVHDFGFLGQTKFVILGIDVHLAILVLAVVAVVFYLLMSRTQYGQHMYAIGANSRAARLAGISLERKIIVAFALSGLTVAVASLLLTSQTGVVDPTTGDRLEFLALTGVMIGGASLHGGRGSVSGTLMAIVILAVFDNGLVLLQVPSFYQEVFRGALLLAAVIFDEAQRRSKDVRMAI